MALSVRFLLCLIIVSIITATQSHPTLYPEVKLKELQTQGVWPPPFRSYHIHCLFQEYDPTIKAKAEALKTRFIKQFNLENVKMCQGLFHQGRLCMFETEGTHPLDPFVSGDWAAFIPLEYFNTTVPWIMQNRGDLDILVHPNSGAEKHDHSAWCLWGGHVWPINMAAFHSVNDTNTQL